MDRQEEARIEALVEAATASGGAASRRDPNPSDDPEARAVGRVADAVPSPRAGAEAASMSAFLARAEALRAPAAASSTPPAVPFGAVRSRWRLRFGQTAVRLDRRAWTALAAMAAVAVGAGALVPRALPGDAVYPLKRAWEDGQLAVVEPYDAICTILERRMASERRDEVRALLERGRPESVTFSGIVTAAGEGTFEVEGIPIRLDAAAELVLPPAPGLDVEVRGRTTGSGYVVAERVGAPPGTS